MENVTVPYWNLPALFFLYEAGFQLSLLPFSFCFVLSHESVTERNCKLNLSVKVLWVFIGPFLTGITFWNQRWLKKNLLPTSWLQGIMTFAIVSPFTLPLKTANQLCFHFRRIFNLSNVSWTPRWADRIKDSGQQEQMPCYSYTRKKSNCHDSTSDTLTAGILWLI